MTRPKQTPVRYKCLTQMLTANHSYSAFRPKWANKGNAWDQSHGGKERFAMLPSFRTCNEKVNENRGRSSRSRRQAASQSGNLLKGTLPQKEEAASS